MRIIYNIKNLKDFEMDGAQKKHIIVTGGNAGIGLALCKQLAVEDGCYVFMGSRSLERGGKALEDLVATNPTAKGNIEVVQVDVTDQASIVASAAAVK